MVMKNPRKRRKAGPATACAPDLDLFTSQKVTVTADGECDERRSRSAADDLHPECDGRSRHLYVYSQTLDCVLQRQCIPCLHKIFLGGRNDHYLLELLSSTGVESRKGASSSAAAVTVAVAIDTGSVIRKPTRGGEEYPSNTRPELCVRSGLKPVSKVGRGCMSPPQVDLMTNIYGARLEASDFQSEYAVLTVGDGDFTFSLSLAETDKFQQCIDCKDSSGNPSCIMESHPRIAGCRRLKLTATSHESYQSICITYPHAVDTLNRLKHLGATVLHDVDATDLQHGSPFAAEDTHTFDFIIWNFPCVSLPAGADGQTSELEQNRALLRRFFANIRPFLTVDRGEVHITHKTIVSTHSQLFYVRSRYSIAVVLPYTCMHLYCVVCTCDVMPITYLSGAILVLRLAEYRPAERLPVRLWGGVRPLRVPWIHQPEGAGSQE